MSLRRLVPLLIFALSLTACGNKGPLVRPPTKSPTPSPQPAPAPTPAPESSGH